MPRPRTFDVFLFAAELGTDGVDTYVAPVERTTCGFCEHGHPTSVRVHGDPDPRPDITDPITTALCCRCCAPTVVDAARAQQRSGCDRDIAVDLCNLKGDWK